MTTVNENPDLSLLPSRPFDGQVFVDFYGVQWVFDDQTSTWVNNGKIPEIPVATEQNTGLLDKQLKQLVDAIPERGGGFGIIVQPVLATRPINVKPLFSDKILRKKQTSSGFTIYGEKPFVKDKEDVYNKYVPHKMAGLLLEFKTGTLKNKQFLIYDNDDGRIFGDGDITSAAAGDKFDLFDPVELNPHGILSGDVELVSDSLDIKCVTGEKDVDACNTVVSDAALPSGLQFSLKEKLLDTLCVEIPGCKGPKGEKGPQGESGKIGTGDGPQGDPGAPGKDASEVLPFLGIKVTEVDDIYDTAVVALEPDPDNGKLYVVKAKIKVPTSDTAADQVVATAINRTVEFSEEFFFNIVRPALDPIATNGQTGIPVTGTKEGSKAAAGCFLKSDFENDVLVAVVPKGGSNDGSTQVGIRWLSDLLNDIADFYRSKIQESIDKWDNQIKDIITQKDQEARQVICQLAQELAECEWELPLEYCVSLVSGDCSKAEESTTSFPIAASIFGAEKYNADTSPVIQLVAISYVLGGEGKQWPETPIVVRMDNKSATGLEVNTKGEISDPNVTDSLPAGDYILMWDHGSMYDYDFPNLGYFVGGWIPTIISYGVQVEVLQPGETDGTITNFPVPEVLTKAQITKSSPLGAWCVSLPLGDPSGKQYFCDVTNFASSPAPAWVEGAFQGYWSPTDQREFNGINQVPPPGTKGPGYTVPPRSEFDAAQVEEAYRQADILKKSLSFSFSTDGGKLNLLCPLIGGTTGPQFANREQSKESCITGSNTIRFKLYKVYNKKAVFFT